MVPEERNKAGGGQYTALPGVSGSHNRYPHILNALVVSFHSG